MRIGRRTTYYCYDYWGSAKKGLIPSLYRLWERILSWIIFKGELRKQSKRMRKKRSEQWHGQ